MSEPVAAVVATAAAAAAAAAVPAVASSSSSASASSSSSVVDSWKVYSCASKGAKLECHTMTAIPLQPHEIEVKVSHNGLCHTDCHLRDDDWSCTMYPLIAGHEVVGIITAIGSGVTDKEIGQRVGFGWIKDSCAQCDRCIRGHENICKKGYTGLILNGNRGGFQERIRSAAKFAFPIPANLPSEYAAPLLCAGITVYNPLRTYITRPNMRVGIIGIGGLGHMAVQFAAALGAEVTAFSTSDNKKSEAIKLGATYFVNSTNKESMDAQKDSFDILLDTVSAPIDWSMWLDLLMYDSKFIVVGLPPTNISVPLTVLVDKQLSIVGSIVAGRSHTNEMLQLAADKKIYPMIEKRPLSQVNEAMQHLLDNKARYRIVLESDFEQTTTNTTQ